MSIKESMKGFKEGQKEFGETIGVIVNSALLSVVYFLIIGPTSIIAKIVGNIFLDMKISKETKTYWEDLNLTKKTMGEYCRQF